MRTRFPLIALAAIGLSAGFIVAQAADPPTTARIDELLIQAQKICPVSGGALGSMGAPIKAHSEERTIFLCCKNCVGKPIPDANWTKVTANLIKAQGTCPVTGKPLPEKSPVVTVSGRMVFVCCEDCPEKVKAAPDKYLAIVNQSLEANLKKSGGATKLAP